MNVIEIILAGVSYVVIGAGFGILRFKASDAFECYVGMFGLDVYVQRKESMRGSLLATVMYPRAPRGDKREQYDNVLEERASSYMPGSQRTEAQSVFLSMLAWPLQAAKSAIGALGS